MNEAFLVLMQTTTDGGRTWDDVGVPEVVEGARSDDSVYDVGIDWALDNEPDQGGWRVLVWTKVEEGYNQAGPDATITVDDLPTNRPRTHVLRVGRKHHRPRTRGPVFACVTKVPAGPELLRERVLITDDPRNCAGARFMGTAWFPAHAAEGAVSALVHGYGTMQWRGEEVFSLHTAIGEVRMVPGQPVILDDQP